MATDHIRYDLMVQDALRSVVRKVLADAARDGLPGEHHFFIKFRTTAPGVRLSSRMRERYPDEMTVILQHQYWDLSVTEHAFEVGLSFSNVPERVLVPFDSITGFFDPSVQFGLEFEAQEAAKAGANDTGEARPALPAPVTEARPRTREAGKATRGAGSEPTEVKPATALREAVFDPAARSAKSKEKDKTGAEKKSPAPEGGKDAKVQDAKILLIDAFRKKT